jgi:tripartite-type tricarboxylate transporter receptor subunit TctC
VTQTVMLEESFKTPGVQYKATEFTYVGRMTAVLETMISWHGAKAQNIKDVRKYETVAGGTGPTSPTEGYPRLLNAFAGTKFKVVSGYGGTTDIMLAMERGEINVLIQAALERSKELPDVPTLVELGNTPEDQAALAFYVSSAAVSRSMIATPGIPPERVKALRDAFNETGKDPQFLAEVEKTQSEFTPATGEYLQELARKVAATPPDIIQRTSEALRVK